MDRKNVVSVYLYTGEMGPWDLHLAAQDFILQHFEQVYFTIYINGDHFVYQINILHHPSLLSPVSRFKTSFIQVNISCI